MSVSIDSLKVFGSYSKGYTFTPASSHCLAKLSIKGWSLVGDADLTVDQVVNKAFSALGDLDLCLEETTLNDRLIELLVDARNVQILTLRQCILTEDEFIFFEGYPVKEKVIFEGCKIADFSLEGSVDAEAVKIDTQMEIRPRGPTKWAPEYAPLTAEVQKDLEGIGSQLSVQERLAAEKLVQEMLIRGKQLLSNCHRLQETLKFYRRSLGDCIPLANTTSEQIAQALESLMSKTKEIMQEAKDSFHSLKPGQEMSRLESQFQEVQERCHCYML